MPMWVVDLTRPWMSSVPATDASPAYGFGFCAAKMSPEEVRNLAAHAGQGSHTFRLRRASGDPPEKPRIGPEYRLNIGARHFKTILSVRAKTIKHSGELEGEAVVLALRRMARNVKLHRHRGLFFVDALAVLGALQKGRSSAPSLRSVTRQVAALTMAADWRWRYDYLLSESNPADAPSRGVRPSRRQRKARNRSPMTVSERHFTKQKCLASRLFLGRPDSDSSCGVADSSSM